MLKVSAPPRWVCLVYVRNYGVLHIGTAQPLRELDRLHEKPRSSLVERILMNLIYHPVAVALIEETGGLVCLDEKTAVWQVWPPPP